MHEEQGRTFVETRQIITKERATMFLLQYQLGRLIEEGAVVMADMLAQATKTAEGCVDVELDKAPERLLRRC